VLPDWKIWECNGAKYILFERTDIIADSLKTTGAFEDDLIKISCLLCDEINDPLILDIGANLGSYAIPMAQYLRKFQGELFAYEPQRIPFYQLCANVLLNRLDNIFPINIALGSVESEVEVYDLDISMWNSGAYSLVKEFRKAEGIDSHLKSSSVKVTVSTLDQLDFSRNVHLIKMDVEGYELHIIKGGESFLEENGYPYVIFEAWNSSWYLDQKNTLLQKFFSLGYEITQIDNTNFLAQHKTSMREVNISNIDGIKRASLSLR